MSQQVNVTPTPVMPSELVRWFVNHIEARALEVYWSTGNIADVEHALAGFVETLKKMGRGTPSAMVGESPCPWTRCPDGSCRPDCNV